MAEQKKIIIVAGEASGDLHASHLVTDIKNILPDTKFYGLGGSKMRAAGVELFYDLTTLSVVGFFEVLKHLKTIRKIFHELLKKVDEIKPAAVILVDFPGFNLRLAEQLKKRNIKVIYYISPQIWAWGLKRVHLIKRVVDKMLVILPFEEKLYRKYGADATFVGHPLLDLAKPTESAEKFISSVSLAPDKTTIALLPGSRNKEVERLLPPMLKACRIIHRQNPQTQFLLLKASTVEEKIFQKILSKFNLPLYFAIDQTYNGLNVATVAIVTSGTATLETAIMQKPMVIIYKVSFLTWVFIKQMIKIPYIGLVNVVAGKKIVPECLQYEATPEIIAQNILEILKDKEKFLRMINDLSQLRQKLGKTGASMRAAEIVAGVLNQ
ncbi:MAG: lipid-A-disaccharide synthase [Candidatus Omnitrophota bacterium]|nr:lipid-A-disaccharide synthase [Candidatus Omnitrophota bacterium]